MNVLLSKLDEVIDDLENGRVFAPFRGHILPDSLYNKDWVWKQKTAK